MRFRILSGTLLLLISSWTGKPALLAQTRPLPQIVHTGSHYAFLLDGKPYFILGAQIHNSSSWAVSLPKVWTLAAGLHANTVEAPVYWEQMEQQPGVFDFSGVDTLIQQARAHHFHLILLWFGTWKNGRMHYTPEWIKTDPQKYPRMVTPDGDPVDVLSPYSENNLNADKTAFAALMRHVKAIDSAEQTVIMVQVENETGSLGTVRDYSSTANKLFQGPVPAALIQALHKQPGTWKQVFGDDADEAFAAYGVSHYVDQVAAAGKAEYALPMYVNNWLRSPNGDAAPGSGYPSGGPTSNMLDIWKATAPALDMIGPDIYRANSDDYRQVMQQFHRPDNPLWIPETLGFYTGTGPGVAEDFSRFLFYALGQDALGYSPFGLDSLPADAFAKHLSPQLDRLAQEYELLGSMDRELAKLLYQGKVQTAVQEPLETETALDFGKWKAVVSFGLRRPAQGPQPNGSSLAGRVLVAPIGPDEFLVLGWDARVNFVLAYPAVHQHPQDLRVEQGTYDGANWMPSRWLNGDETDSGLLFGQDGSIDHIQLGTY
jgi:beta-galactosidase GanA